MIDTAPVGIMTNTIYYFPPSPAGPRAWNYHQNRLIATGNCEQTGCVNNQGLADHKGEGPIGPPLLVLATCVDVYRVEGRVKSEAGVDETWSWVQWPTFGA